MRGITIGGSIMAPRALLAGIAPFALFTLGVVVNAACSPTTSSENNTGPAAMPDSGADADATMTPATVKLMGRPWDAAAIDNEIARIMLTEKMGIPVEIVPHN